MSELPLGSDILSLSSPALIFGGMGVWQGEGRQAGEGYWSQLPAQRSSTMGFSKVAEPACRIRIRSYLGPTLPSSRGRQQVWV